MALVQRSHRGNQPDAQTAIAAAETHAADVPDGFDQLNHALTPSRPAAMRAIRIVQTVVGKEQVTRISPQDRLGHDPSDVFDLNPAIPDPLRMNHHGRAVFALLRQPA
jgi:hypothetical protein